MSPIRLALGSSFLAGLGVFGLEGGKARYMYIIINLSLYVFIVSLLSGVLEFLFSACETWPLFWGALLERDYHCPTL